MSKKLGKKARQTILERILKPTHEATEKQRRKCANVVALELRTALTPLEVLEAMATLPHPTFERVEYLRGNYRGERFRLRFASPQRVWWPMTQLLIIPHTRELPELTAFLAWEKDQQKQADASRVDVATVLESHKSVESLIREWPEIKSIVLDVCGSSASVPRQMPNHAKLNAALGLS
ncbi:MAG: hypothetical protein GY767_22570 [Shimia sp.]|nr:hypothetical protein [Shimia sp.]